MGTAARVWLGTVPSPRSCQMMPFPSIHRMAKRHRKCPGFVMLPAPERLSTLRAACRSRPVPIRAAGSFRAAVGSSSREPKHQGGGRAVVWELRAQITGEEEKEEEDVLRTPRSSPSPPAESMDCNRKAGFYYDELLKKCINCSTICGQHPKQCAPSCERKAAPEGRESRDVGLGWKRSRVMEPKLGKGQQNPPLLVPGVVCVLPFH